MTSRERHLQLGQARWNLGVQSYKENRDVFMESGLLSIIVLAHGRLDITRKSIESTLACIKRYAGEIEWIFIENGGCDATYAFFQGLDLERKVVVRQKNYGINEGLNQGWALSRGEYCMIHENDWFAVRQSNFIQYAKEILDENPGIGVVQLRDPFDPHENFGYNKPTYNPWSCSLSAVIQEGIEVKQRQTNSGHIFYTANYPNGFNNNPIIIRKQVYRDCGPYPEVEMGSDPRWGEAEYQARVAELGCTIAYVGIGVYQHMGQVQTKAM